MKKPAGRTMLMGHPVLAVPATLVSGLTLVAGIYGRNLFVGIIALVILGGVQKAQAEAGKYRAWVRDWNALGDDAPRQRKPISWPLVLLGGIWAVLFALSLIGGAHPGDAALGSSVLVGALVVIIVALSAMIRWARHGRRGRRVAGSAMPTVAIVARPVMPVPSLRDAYRALPAHCQAVLGSVQ